MPYLQASVFIILILCIAICIGTYLLGIEVGKTSIIVAECPNYRLSRNESTD